MTCVDCHNAPVKPLRGPTPMRCPVCRRARRIEQMRAWRKANPERVREIGEQSRARVRERIQQLEQRRIENDAYALAARMAHEGSTC